jgi:hypothetical protein
MRNRLTLIALSLTTSLVGACTLPGAASPTPFTFPTPNLTLTAVFASVVTATPLPQATSTPIPPTGSPTPTGIPLGETPGPTELATSTVSSASRPNGTLVTAAFLTTPPTIDGALSDWNTTPYTVNYVVYGSRSGTNDISATYRIGWDPSYLYLGVQVTDDKVVQISQGRSIYKGDEVEIQLDAALDSDFTSTTMSADDYQIGMSPGDFDSNGPEAYRWYPSSKAGSLTNILLKSAETTSGYNLEARIPWSVFGTIPQSGDHYGFVLSVSDDDQSGKAVQETLISSVSTRKLLNPTTWGTLELEPSGGS